LPDVFVFQPLAARLPFEREFDVVTALDVLEHIDDDREALTAVFRAVRPGGGVVLTVPQHRWLWSAVDEFSCHRRRYTRGDLEEKIRASGFEVCRATSCFATTLPLVIASRSRSTLGTFDPVRELQIPRALNSLLNGLVECEWTAIRLGVSLPVGGSLLVVARRPLA
jgi:SAM-dependent methyltransferase